MPGNSPRVASTRSETPGADPRPRGWGRNQWRSIEARDIRIVERKGPYRYLYGNGRYVKRGHHGKEQFYFLCDYSGPDARINVDTKHPEFQAFRWIAPEDFQITWLPEMKRVVYRAVFRGLLRGLRI